MQQNQEKFVINIDAERLICVLHKNNKDDGANTCVVCCHGMLASKDGPKYIKLGEVLSDQNIDMVRFDFRGCGESDGRLQHSNITKRLEDLEAVLDFFIDEYGFKKFGLFGSSMGAFISYVKASIDKDNHIKSMVSLASPFSMIELFEKHKVDDSHFEVDGIIFGEEFLTDMNNHGSLSQEILGKVKCPVYLFHGDNDRLVPVEHAHNIFRYLNTKKEIKIINGGDHIFSRQNHIKDIIKITSAWFCKYLTGD